LNSTKIVRSPLRYPGGKSRAVKTLFEYIPPGTKSICSPFFGGGSLEIFCAQKGIKIHGYDNFRPLVDFWKWLIKDPYKLAEEVEKHRPLEPREKFKELRKQHVKEKDSFQRAVLFYVLNRTSFSGSTLSGGMASGGEDDNPRFTESSVQRLRDFKVKNFSVKFMDFKKSIPKHPNDLLYLDPPYLIENNLYGNRGDLHKDFDHEGLVKLLRKREKWILSYNDSEKIKKMYKGFQFVYPEWAYGMKNIGKRNVKTDDDKNKVKKKKKKKMGKSQEILILSNDIPIPKE